MRLWWRLDGTGPAVLLVPGRGDSSDLYPVELSDALIAAGFAVLRFDPRDTGLSSDGGDQYRLSDMADDLVVVCAAAEVEQAHVVGLSMGGIVTVDVAARHPAAVASLTFISAMSPDPRAGIGEAFLDGIGAEPVAGTLASMGSPTADDETWVRANMARAGDRAPERPEAATRHQAAALRLGWPELDALATITADTLVVHGTADRVLPVAHAHALAAGIANSRLCLLEGMGHLATRAEWLQIADLVVAHLDASSD